MYLVRRAGQIAVRSCSLRFQHSSRQVCIDIALTSAQSLPRTAPVQTRSFAILAGTMPANPTSTDGIDVVDVDRMSPDELKEFAKAILAENTALKVHLGLKKEVVALREEMAMLRAQFKALTSALGARDMAPTFERELMLYIWKDCLSKPFYIYSLKNLTKFLRHPDTAYDDGICGVQAPELFSAKPEEEQAMIRKRMAAVKRLIDFAIFDVLKNVGNKVAHRQFAEPDEMIAFFQDDQPEVAEAMTELLRAKIEFATASK